MSSTTAGRPTTVLVADAQPLFAEALGCALGAEADLTVIAEHPVRGFDAMEAIVAHQPDVVVYDHWMLELDGPALSRAATEYAPSTRVLLLSWYHGPPQIQAALTAGAAGFLPKSVHLDELIEAVRRAAAGEPLVFGEELARLVDGLDRRFEIAREVADQAASLSPRELEVLQALTEPRTRALSETAEALGISPGTLKNHIHRILAKTGTTTQMEAVNFARQQGLVVDRHGSASGGPALPAAQNDKPTASAGSGRPRRSSRTCSVMVADTERLFAESLARCLVRTPGLSVVPVAPTRGTEAVDAILYHRPDVVLYDLWLRGMQGTAAALALRQWAPATKPVLMSWFHGRPQVRRALAAGTSAMVPKSSDLATLVARVRGVHERDPAEHGAELTRLVDLLRGESGQDEGLTRLLTLTPREMQVLQLLALGSPTKNISQMVSLALGTVKNLISQILTKTAAGSQAEAVALARRHGFLE